MASNLKLYPSGFLGSAKVDQIGYNETLRLKREVFGKPTDVKSKETANRTVYTLWKNATESNECVTTFDYKSDVVKAALAAFGTLTIREWLLAQTEGQTYGTYHQAWIEETIEFVLEGKSRKMPYIFWLNMLNPAVQKETAPHSFKLNELFGEFGTMANMQVSALVIEWVKHPTGMDDLIQSLNVLFGLR